MTQTPKLDQLGGAAPAIVNLDVRVVIRARVQCLSTIDDNQLSQSVLAMIAILAPFAAQVQSISVERGGLVGIAGGAAKA